MWDPETYLKYADERGRPFLDLVNRIGADRPADVVDLGCGPGNLTKLLALRWPSAAVLGVDSSAEMIASTPSGPISFEIGDVRTWRPAGPVDVIVSNATLQWVPGHLDLLPRLVSFLAPGGWLAVQVPGNFDEPSHTIRRELAESDFPELVGLPEPAAYDAATYLGALQGCDVDAWETTYFHQLGGPDPVFTWISGTSARPMLDALEGDRRAAFESELKRRLATAYPDSGSGVLMPFRRVFVVAQAPA